MTLIIETLPLSAPLAFAFGGTVLAFASHALVRLVTACIHMVN